jgi:hypothetical protein
MSKNNGILLKYSVLPLLDLNTAYKAGYEEYCPTNRTVLIKRQQYEGG